MKRLLLPLIAALALPTAVSAETWWLMAAGRKVSNGISIPTWSIPTSSIDECEAAGQKFKEHNWKNLEKQTALVASIAAGQGAPSSMELSISTRSCRALSENRLRPETPTCLGQALIGCRSHTVSSGRRA